MLKTAIINLTSQAFNTIKRFPLSTLCSLLFCSIALTIVYNNYNLFLEDSYYLQLIKILFFGFFWFTALKLFVECHKWNYLKHYTLGLIVFAVIATLNATPLVSTSFFYMSAALFLMVFLAPFLKRNSTSSEFWEFNYKLCLHLALAVITAIILFCGVSAILLAITYFFNIKFDSDIYVYLWLIVATLFAPLLALALLPKHFDKLSKNYPKYLETLLSYIIIPLIFVFSAIIYIYIAKMVWVWELPKGGVANIITIFGCTGMLVYFMSYPLHNSHSIIGIFHRNFFKIMLAPLALLIVAISYRIKQYGITEERYTILLWLTWFILSMIFAFTLSATRTARLICLSLISLLLLGSYGPWSATNVSLASQLNRLESALTKNGILVDGQIVAKGRDLNDKEIKEIASMLSYIYQSKGISMLKPWFSNMPNAEVYKKPDYFTVELILSDMGLSKSDPSTLPSKPVVE